jgi:hypothetical protein
VGLANLGSESETFVGSLVHLLGVSISFDKNFYRLPSLPPSLVRHFGPSTSPTKSQRERPRINHKKIAKKGLQKSPKRRNRRDTPKLEEPHRIIYTYHEGSYKVLLAARSSFPLTRSHREALKLVLEITKENGR